MQVRKRVHGSGDGNGNTDMSNKNTDLTEDKVWGLEDGESNGYVVLDAHKVCTGRGRGETSPRTRSGGSRTEKVTDTSSLIHTRFVQGEGGYLVENKVWGLQDGESNGYIVLDAHKVCTGRWWGDTSSRTRSGGSRPEKVMDTSSLMHTRFVWGEGGGGRGERPHRGRGLGTAGQRK